MVFPIGEKPHHLESGTLLSTFPDRSNAKYRQAAVSSVRKAFAASCTGNSHLRRRSFELAANVLQTKEKSAATAALLFRDDVRA
jgi:hypothetical protein